jgi:lipoate-protein ligase A
MARDQGLLDLAEREGTAVLRLYAWDPFCISFGRNEPALRRYDKATIQTQNLDTVRRPTGGRAVWHARELTYAVAAPLDAFGSLKAAYHGIHHMLSRAVRTLGADATLAGPQARTASLDSGACFASPAGGEVMVEGAKVIGSAQLQQGRAFLQHGSFLLQDTQEVIQQVTRGSPPRSADRPLSHILGKPLTFEDAIEAIVPSLNEWAADWTLWDKEGDLVELAQVHRERFRSPDWTWRR